MDDLVNSLQRASKPRVSRLIVGQTQAGATVAAGQFTLTWVVPEGYKKCTGVFFDPANDLSVTLYSQNLVSNFLQNFSTKTGSAIGMIDPGHNYAERDVITGTITPKTLTATPQDLTISLRFE